MEHLDHLISGIQQYQKGNIDDAMEIARNVLKQDPLNAIALILSGNCYLASGEIEEAIQSYKDSLRIDPTSVDAMMLLAKAYRQIGQGKNAVDTYQNLLAQDPTNTNALLSMGELLVGVSLEKAEKAVELALKINPELSYAYVILGRIAKERHAGVEEAIGHCLRAIELNPNDPHAYNLLGSYLMSAGDPVAACRAYKKILDKDIKKFPLVHSNWVFTQHYIDDISPKELFENHRNWQKCYENDWRSLDPMDFKNAPDIKKKLKVGLTSSDFRKHSVFNFLHGLFDSYDRENFEFICFSTLGPSSEDIASEIIKTQVDDWQVIHGLNSMEMQKIIIEQEIDILIDLSGHTGDNSLPLYMRRAAPVQVTWLGYPDTTGLDSMDYRIVDSVTDPEPWADELASEHLYRLPSPFLCYSPYKDWADIKVEPQTQPDRIVFGTFNEAPKFSPSVVRLWCEILRRIPQAELVIKCRPFGEEKTKEFVMGYLKKYGIEEDRVKLMGFIQNQANHLATYNVMDVALDPFPYNGTTTSCEALWMGVPMITREGDRHCARVGMSLLKAIGLEDWIAYSDEEYVAKAVEVANNREQLAEIKRTLRQRMQNSPLCDQVGFARKFEAALREMWQSWCEKKSAKS